MANRLVPCVGCSRHFRAMEAACPFCGRSSADSVTSAPTAARPEGRPLTRAAILFATATTAASAMACGKSPADHDPVVVQPYGVPVPPPTDAGPTPPEPTATPDASTPVVVQPYGVPVPPPDAGPKTKPIPTNAVPAYGVPPPTKH